jgi:hypothetical protein
VNAERRVHRTWGERFFLEPIYYWLDLYGPDGRPSHHKVLTALGFLFALGAELVWGKKLVAEQGAGIDWPYVFLVVATLAVPMGKGVFQAVAGRNIPGGAG